MNKVTKAVINLIDVILDSYAKWLGIDEVGNLCRKEETEELKELEYYAKKRGEKELKESQILREGEIMTNKNDYLSTLTVLELLEFLDDRYNNLINTKSKHGEVTKIEGCVRIRSWESVPVNRIHSFLNVIPTMDILNHVEELTGLS